MNIALTATLLMLLSAVLHAAGATLLKSSAHKHAVRGISLFITFLIAVFFVPFVPLPSGMTWVLLLISAVIHASYINLTIATLERGDLGLVYPIMRGAAPVLAAVFAFLLLGETMTGAAVLGLLIVTCTLVLLAGGGAAQAGSVFARYREALVRDHVVLLFALGTAVGTALYSVTDAAGVRSVENPWSYVVWFGVVVEPICFLTLWARRRKTFFEGVRAEWQKGLLFGLITAPGFAIAIYVYSLGPVARLSALRETSVFFAAIFATIFLKEKFGLRRVVLAAVICVGLWLMHQ